MILDHFNHLNQTQCTQQCAQSARVLDTFLENRRRHASQYGELGAGVGVLGQETFQAERLNHLGIVAGVCREIGLAEWLYTHDLMTLFAGIALRARRVFGITAR
jgi:hypothetical protein